MRVLIVDDEKSIRRTLCEFLRAEGYEVSEAEDADMALERLTEAECDVVVTDIILPRVTGVELLRRIHNMAPHVHVVMMTGEPTVETASESLRAGAVDYLFKPISKAAILRVVANAMKIKQLDDTRRRLEAENQTHRDNLERLVEERTQQLQATEERYRLLMETSLDAILLTTPEGDIVQANPAACRMFGRTEEELRRLGRAGVVCETDPRLAVAITDRARSGSFVGELTFIRRDGTLFPGDVASTVFRNREGKAMASVVVRDISERKRAEAETRRYQAELAAIFENSPAMLCLVDSSLQVRRANHSLAHFTGVPAVDILKRRIGDVLGCVRAGSPSTSCGSSPDCPACPLVSLVQRTLQTGETQRQVETRWLLTRGGRTEDRWLITSTARLDVDDQALVLLCLEDVTEKKLTEAKFLRAQRVESIGSLASGIAHDLNNILTPIIMSAPLLQLEDTPEGQAEVIQTIESSAQRAVGIVKQLLSFARGKEGQKTPLQVKHIIRDMAKMAREVFPRNITVAEDYAPDLWLVTADATQLHQVLLNLCVNARDAMPSGGKLTLRTANVTLDEQFVSTHRGVVPGPFVRMDVEDTGTGIPDSLRAHIFESFFTTKGEGQGTGLGLTTVLGIVRDHQGCIHFTTTPGKGTMFSVFLPAVPLAQTRLEPELIRSAIPRGTGQLVLVVDDEPAVGETTRRTLERHGYTVLRAGNGIEAVAQFAAHQGEVRAVVTDMMMPQMDGLTLCRTLRRLSPQTPLIVSSGGLFGQSGSDALRAFAELDIEHILQKPHNADVLLRALVQVIPRSPPPGPATGA